MNRFLRHTCFALAFLCCAAGSIAQDSEDAVSEAEATAMLFDAFFRKGEIHHATLSPTGEFVAYLKQNSVVAGNEYYGYHKILNLYDSARVIDVRWGGDNTVLVQYVATRTGQYYLYSIQIGEDEGDSFGAQRSGSHEIVGYIHDPLPSEPDYIIFAKARVDNDTVAADLFRMNMYGQTFPQTKFRLRVNSGASNLFYYLGNESNELVIGMELSDLGNTLWHRPDPRKGWDEIWTAPADATFYPQRISNDGQTLWALTNATTDKIAAVSFDLATATISELLFEHERFDLDDILFDEISGEPIGVVYTDAGLNQTHYFDDSDSKNFDQLQKLFVDQGISIIGKTPDRNRQLVFVSSPQEAGTIFHCNLPNNSCDKVEATRPWLDDVQLAETQHLVVETDDGLTIDAFLTLPADTAGGVPVIAMPHGGPIGISDHNYYSPHVQWLAQSGYAVLRVNYRGSGGYGREFQSSGLREWGRGIEQDVEAAVRFALAEYPVLDSNRVGIFGSSYGGYSALISAIEKPDLFKCAASFAGVTDLTLLFNRSDIRRSEVMTDELIRMVGNPRIDYDELVRYSPVYQYERISRPIFLAHGDNDPVVDVEHTLRLKAMLNMIGKEPEVVILRRVEHGFDYVGQAYSLYGPLVRFLDEHLK